jgi:hypothetical protein
MSRHLIIGRYGPGDRVACPAAADEHVTQIDLVASQKQLGYGIGHALTDLRKLGVVPTEIALDLLVLAALVYAADTRISRKSESEDSWTREIRLVVPVSDLVRWNAGIPVLQRMLNFLTGDIWLVGFRARPPRFAMAVSAVQHLIDPPFDEVSLFSGGLDSLIGAIDLLESGQKPLLVSHSAEGAVSKAQGECYDRLTTHYKGKGLERLRLWMSFPQNLVIRSSSPSAPTSSRFGMRTSTKPVTSERSDLMPVLAITARSTNRNVYSSISCERVRRPATRY